VVEGFGRELLGDVACGANPAPEVLVVEAVVLAEAQHQHLLTHFLRFSRSSRLKTRHCRSLISIPD
jgi:hypothetical protein